jgi:HPt (histidine-containing phosphotransfer) domain-containing protein
MSERMIAEVDEDLSDLIPGFLTHKREDLQTINGALRKNQFEVVGHLAHRMKGEGAGYGFDPISELGKKLEDAARGRDAAACARWTAELANYLEHVEVVFQPAER